MSDFISPFLQWINAHPHLAGLATFIISAAESIAIIGTIVPGSVMMTAIGTLAGAGVMPLWSTIIWAILGAIVGDGVSYWLGYYFKDRIRLMWPFKDHAYLLDSGEKFFHKYGSMSVFIGRFVGPVRALVPLVAGMLRMRPLRFTIANVTSAILWAPAYMLPGIALGAASLELPRDLAAHVLLMFFLIGLFIILCLWVLIKLFELISTQVDNLLSKLWKKLHLSGFFSPVTRFLKHHHPEKTYGQLTRAFYALIILSLLIYLSWYITHNNPQTISLNNLFFYLSRSLRSPTLDAVMLNITMLGEYTVILPVMFIFFIALTWKKQWHTAGHVLLAVGLTVLGIEIFKHVTKVQRPWGIAHPPLTASFPSGHATLALVFFLGTALLIVHSLKQRYRFICYPLAWIIILAVGFSRIYLGFHWFTDVIGGFLLGGAVLLLTVTFYNRRLDKPIPVKFILMVLGLSLAFCTSIHYTFNHENQKRNIALIDWPIKSISLNDWWNQQGENLPHFRINRLGFSTQILNIQWLGNLDSIHSILLQNGWQIPPARDWVTILHRLSDVESSEHLPLLSPLYLDKEPVLELTKRYGKKLIVLRLWNPNLFIKNINLPLWVGTVEAVPRTYSWLFNPKHATQIHFSTSLLFKKPPENHDIKVIHIKSRNHRRADEQLIYLIKSSNILFINSTSLRS